MIMAAPNCEKAADSNHLWTGRDMPKGARSGQFCRCVFCGDIGCVSMRTDEKWVENRMEGIYTTKVQGSDGVIYDLASVRFLPKGVLAVNAWTEKISDLPEPAGEGGRK